jgi:hypothetical protein
MTIQSGTGGIGAPKRTEFSGDVRLVWGDVSLRADRIVYDEGLGNIVANGNIVLVRGIETIRGSSITIFFNTGTFVVQNGVVVSPPYSIAGERIEQVGGVLRASRAVVAPDVDARGEVIFRAREVRFIEGGYTELSDVRIYLYGQRVLTLPRYRILSDMVRDSRCSAPPATDQSNPHQRFRARPRQHVDSGTEGYRRRAGVLPSQNGPQYLSRRTTTCSEARTPRRRFCGDAGGTPS